MDFQEFILNFILNFITEIIGIILTIFVVDRLIRHHYELQRKPARKIVYGRLFGLTSDILSRLIPEEIMLLSCDFDSYLFGNYCVPILIKTSQVQANSPAMLALIYENLRERKELDITNLHLAKKQLREIIDQEFWLLNAELLNLLLQVDMMLEDVIEAFQKPLPEEDLLLLQSFKIVTLLQETIKLRALVETEADSRYSAIKSLKTFTISLSKARALLDNSRKFAAALINDEVRKEIENLKKLLKEP
jgi:hypothetical protein